MKYLLDTDTCIYFLNGNRNIAKKLTQISDQKIFTTILNIAELKFGAYNSKKIKYNLSRIDEFKQRINILDDFSENIITSFAHAKADLRKKGKTIGDFDLLIAAFAINNNLTLITNNFSHFNNISNLKSDNWT